MEISEEKIEMLLHILKDLSFEEWQWLKRDIDDLYSRIQSKNVPNSELETFQVKLKRCYIN